MIIEVEYVHDAKRIELLSALTSHFKVFLWLCTLKSRQTKVAGTLAEVLHKLRVDSTLSMTLSEEARRRTISQFAFSSWKSCH
jgi:hypothetical protein